MKHTRKNGINLVVLIITIVVMIILASAIIIEINSDDTMDKAEELTLKTDISTMLNQYSILKNKLDYKLIQGEINSIKSEDFKEIVPPEYAEDFVATPEGLAYIGNDEQVKKIALEMGCILKDAPIIEDFKLSPSEYYITASVSVANYTNNIVGYKYYWGTDKENLSKSAEASGSSYKIEGLQKGTVYYVKVDVIYGNDKKTVSTNIKETITFSIESPRIELSTYDWTRGPITATVTYPSEYNFEKSWSLVIGGNVPVYSKVVATSNKVNISENSKLYAKVENLNGNVAQVEKEITNIDREAPKAFDMSTASTTSSITITGSTTDTVSGIGGYRFSIDGGNVWVESKDIKGSYTFEGLKQDTKYTVQMQAIDKAGNVTFTPTREVATEKLVQPTINVSTTSWTNQNVTTSISYQNVSGIKKQYSFNGIDWLTYTGNIYVGVNEYSLNGSTFIRLSEDREKCNVTIYARVMDNAGQVSTRAVKQITNIDKIEPTVSIGQNGGTYLIPTGYSLVGVQITFAANDVGGSGLNTVQYAWSTSNVEPTTGWTNFNASGYKVTFHKSKGTYYLWTKVIDNATNRATNIKVSKVFKLLDSTDPTAQIKITPNTTGWINNDLPIYITYGSNISVNKKYGISSMTSIPNSVNSASYIASGNGTLKAEGQDKFGNLIKAEYDVKNIDKLLPNQFNLTVKSTSTSLTVYASTTDAVDSTGKNGTSGIAGYKYSKDNGATWTSTVTSTAYTFSNLTSGNSYNVRVKAVDNAGNEREATNNGTVVDVLGEIGIKTVPTTYRNTLSTGTQNGVATGPITATITYGNTSKHTYQYKIGNGAWQTATKTQSISITENTTIYARYYYNGVEYYGKSYSVTNVDNEAPKLNYTVETNGNINITVTDNKQLFKVSTSFETYNISGKSHTEMVGNISRVKDIEIFDVAGNSTGKIYINIANAPELSRGMIPVKWNEENEKWEITTIDDPEWFWYTNSGEDNSRWANMMLSDGRYYASNVDKSNFDENYELIKEWSDELTKEVAVKGQLVNNTEMGSMYVWIPRYAYKIDYNATDVSGYHTKNPGTIEIEFISKNTTGTSKSYITTKNGKSVQILDGTEVWSSARALAGGGSSEKGTGYWRIHPTFTSKPEHGGWDKELAGIWVAKFENSSKGTYGEEVIYKETSNGKHYHEVISSLPNAKIPQKYSSSGYINSNTAERACEFSRYEIIEAKFGLVNSNYDSHLIKNSEWGAAAYLAYSSYGRNKETITINQGSGSGYHYDTGDGDYKANVDQSTTGNVYGIYDMAGGRRELVAGAVLDFAFYSNEFITADNWQKEYDADNNGYEFGYFVKDTGDYTQYANPGPGDYPSKYFQCYVGVETLNSFGDAWYEVSDLKVTYSPHIANDHERLVS